MIVPRPRELSGRLQRDREESETKVLAIVLAQPHRRGSREQGRRWPIGRLILDKVVQVRGVEPGTIERAAERYAEDHADQQWLMDSKRPFSTANKGGRPHPTPEQRAEIEKRMGNLRRAVRVARSGERVGRALDAAILSAHPDFDERLFSYWIIGSLDEGLALLVDHYGLRT